jgi:MFS family permease
MSTALNPVPVIDYRQSSDRPTRARYWVIVFAITLAVIQYIDRVCISQAAPEIKKSLGLADWKMGWVFSAFTLAYALFEIPTGYMGDRMGPRRVLTRVVLWWSFFTAATGWVWNWTSLLVTRFLFGAGEAGCFPNLTKAFNRWLPANERARAQGIMWMSARWGGAVTPLLVFAFLQLVHWRTAFVLFGLLGVVWVVVFRWWYVDDPRRHPSVNEAEAAMLPPASANSTEHAEAPWLPILTSRSVWGLCGQYFAASYAWYFYITWFPTYLLSRGLDVKKSALLAGAPLFLGGFGSLVGGWAAARLVRRFGGGGVAGVRRGIGVVGFLGAAAMLVVATRMNDPYLAILAIAMASFFNDITMPGAWAACMDVGGPFCGTLSGTMNMMGNLGGVVSPIVIGYLTGNWDLVFYVTAAIYLAGAACWMITDPVTPLDIKAREPRGFPLD